MKQHRDSTIANWILRQIKHLQDISIVQYKIMMLTVLIMFYTKP